MTDPTNAVFRQQVEGWGELSNRTYIWTYVRRKHRHLCPSPYAGVALTVLYACKVANLENFNLPYPNYYTLGANIKFFAANGARGYYAEGVGYGSGGDLSELKDYLMSSLLWNSSVDPDQVVEEFLDDYCKKHPQFPMSLVISFLMYMQHAHRDLRPFSDGIIEFLKVGRSSF